MEWERARTHYHWRLADENGPSPDVSDASGQEMQEPEHRFGVAFGNERAQRVKTHAEFGGGQLWSEITEALECSEL